MNAKNSKKNDRQYKYIQVSEDIIGRIADGVWKVGEKIPPEAELCQILQVSRVTLRESLKALGMLGIVDIVQGDGTYVKEINPASFIAPLLPLLRCNGVYTEEIYTARIILEGGCCYLAAMHRKEEDLRKLEDIIGEMRAAVEREDYELFSSADKRYHSTINAMCNNEILTMMTMMFSDLTSFYIGKINMDKGIVDNSMNDHVRIYEAIRDRRNDYARVLMSEHLRVSMVYLLEQESDISDSDCEESHAV